MLLPLVYMDAFHYNVGNPEKEIKSKERSI